MHVCMYLLQEISVSLPHTDILVLLLNLVSERRHAYLYSLKFLTGKGANCIGIDVIQRVQVIGIHKCQGPIGLHPFIKANWWGKFAGITKICLHESLHGTRWKLPCDWLFQRAWWGSYLKPIQLELFWSRTLEGEMLPPTCACLLPHNMCANFMAHADGCSVQHQQRNNREQ